MVNQKLNLPLLIATSYLFIALVWVIGGNWVVATMFGSEGGFRIQSGASVAFVASSSIALWFALSRLMPRASLSDRLTVVAALTMEIAPCAIVVLDAELLVVSASNYGMTAANPSLDVSRLRRGQPLSVAYDGDEQEDDAAHLFPHWQAAVERMRRGGTSSTEWSGILDGERRFLRLITLLEGGESEQSGAISVAMDETDIRRRAAADQVYHAGLEMVANGSAVASIADFLASQFVFAMGWHLVWFARQDADDGVSVLASSGRAKELPLSIPVTTDIGVWGQGPTGRAIRTGQIQMIDSSDPGYEPWREAAEALGLHTLLAFPLAGRSGVFGAMCVGLARRRPLEKVDIEQIASWAERAAGLLASAVDRGNENLVTMAIVASERASYSARAATLSAAYHAAATQLEQGVAASDLLLEAVDLARQHVYLDEMYLYPFLRTGDSSGTVLAGIAANGALWRLADEIEREVAEAAEPTALLQSCDRFDRWVKSHNEWREGNLDRAIERAVSHGARVKPALSMLMSPPPGWACEAARDGHRALTPESGVLDHAVQQAGQDTRTVHEGIGIHARSNCGR